MTDPVNTDALRAVGRRLARSVADQWVADAQNAIPDAAAELDRLRAVIENAPHDSGCQFSFLSEHKPRRCTCWKAEVL